MQRGQIGVFGDPLVDVPVIRGSRQQIQCLTATAPDRHQTNIKAADVLIEKNQLLNNVVSCNDMVGNTNYGLKVDFANVPTVIAETNWWGDASGPTHSGNPAGTGDAVTDGADYDPWNAESSVTADGCQPVALPGSTTWFLGLLAALFVGLLALRRGRSVRPA